MSIQWPPVRIGEMLIPATRIEKVDPLKEYRLLGVRLDGQGPFLRETVTGSQTAATNLFRVAKSDFIYSRLFACRGAFGVIADELDGCYVSGEFPTFVPVADRVDLDFLRYWFRLPSVIAQVDEKCTGSTPLTRNRFKENFFLELEIPLPPLAKQRRIVARIEALTAQIEVARRLRQQAVEEAAALMLSVEMIIWPEEKLSDAATLNEVTTYLARGRQSEQGDSQLFLIKSQHVQMGRYVNTPLKLASHVATKIKPEAIVQPKDILIACSAAGCLGRVAFYNDYQKTASTDTHVAIARANQERILPEYLYAYLKGAQGQIQLRSREKGNWKREKISFRLTELNVSDMRKVPVPTPTLDEQRQIVAELQTLQFETEKLKRLQSETSAELNALLPSILDYAFRGELLS